MFYKLKIKEGESMIGSMVQQQYTGKNIQAITIFVYQDFFWVEADKEITGITSKLRIQKANRNITQLKLDENRPSDPDNVITCSVMMGILPILGKHFLLLVQLCRDICSIQGHSIYEVEKVIFVPFEETVFSEKQLEPSIPSTSNQTEKISDIKYYLKNYLLTQGYYFTFKYDLSLSRSGYASGFPSNKKLLWNYNIGKHFTKLEDNRWFIGVIQGSIRSFKIVVDGNLIKYVLITRRSWAKGGTRFNARGVDIKGNVANYCQTEQMLFIKNQCFSHVQIRGSVPLFWKQAGMQQAVSIESNQQKNKDAFKRHIDRLMTHFDKLFCINLLCLDRKGEDDLTYNYEKLIKQHKYKDLKYEYFDVHCASKGQKFQRCNYLVTQKLQGVIKYFGFYQEDIPNQTVVAVQNGVMRSNCLDNLDRTNLIQSKIAYHVLGDMFEKVGIDVSKVSGSQSFLVATDNIENSFIFIIHLKNAWADNGDMISKHYTGTGSTHTNVTRKGKRDIKGIFDHGFKSCMRLYQQFVDDNQKQLAIDVLLCEHTQTVNMEEIQDRLKELQLGNYEGQIFDIDTW